MPQPKSSSLAPLIAVSEQAFCHFTDVAGRAFAKFRAANSDGFSILPLRSREYREWFFTAFYGDYNAVPSIHAFHALLRHLEAQADADPRRSRYRVFRRVGSRGQNIIPDQILLDLANPQGQFVEISSTGWRTTTAMNVNIQSSRSSRPLPAPLPGGPDTLADLRALLNLSSPADWLRCLAWLLAALRPPDAPYPILLLHGPPSSGKTFAARILRALIDPSTANITPTPSSTRELQSFANQNWILSFDHVSTLSPTLSDSLCRLSSIAGMAIRETAAAASEPILDTCKRPILLTVTDRFSCSDDLAERALSVSFAPLPADTRRSEAQLIAAFELAYPRILAALCNALSTALRRLPEMTLPTGRCPDALAWAMAAAPALGCSEEEMRAALNAPPPSGPTVEAVQILLAAHGPWSGTATDLLDILPPSPHFRSPKGLSQHLKSHTLHLAALGIALQFRHPKPNLRLIDLTPPARPPEDASQNPPPPPQPPQSPPLTPTRPPRAKRAKPPTPRAKRAQPPAPRAKRASSKGPEATASGASSNFLEP